MICIRYISLPFVPMYVPPVLIVDTSYVMIPNDRECVNPGRGTVAAALVDRKGNCQCRELPGPIGKLPRRVIGREDRRSLENGDARSIGIWKERAMQSDPWNGL